ncbi:MAG: hypothetical protein CMJ75_06815 [Planctomycetaceae bacterium]|nr:hypothetical protein [Planctomycetaceae bacterium]
MKTLLRMCVGVTVCLFTLDVDALDLVHARKAVATIVVPDQATETEWGAAKRLVKYLKMASGAELPIVREAAAPESGGLVSVGKTDLAKQAGVTDAGLKFDGYRLIVKDRALFLLGRDTRMIVAQRIFRAPLKGGAQGSIRAAFGLLDRLGFRWLQPTPMGIYVPELYTVSVPDDLDVSYEPPFMYMQGRMFNWGDWSLANSFRVSIKAFGRGGHTWPAALPTSLFEEHPECFVMRGGKRRLNKTLPQYCSSNPETRRRVARWTMDVLKQGHEMIQLAQQDSFIPCECELCAKLTPGDQVHNANRRIIEMIGAEYPDRVVQVLIYGPTRTPPTRFESYPPNTLVELTDTREEALTYWNKATAGGLTLYAYYMEPTFDNGYTPAFPPVMAAAKIKRWIAHGVKGIYWSAGGLRWGTEGPTYYVLARLATDPTLDWQQVYQEYLKLTFRQAAPPMKQYYDTLYERLARFRDPTNDRHLIGSGPDGAYKHGGSHRATVKAVYPEETLIDLQRYLERARKRAGDDQRALGWIRLAQIQYEQCALVARMHHEGQTPEAVRKRAGAYYAWVDEIVKLDKVDPEFRKNFFPDDDAAFGPIWNDADRLKTNFGRLPPEWFHWDRADVLRR